MKPLHRRLFIGIEPDRNLQLAIQRHAKEWQWPVGARMTRFGRFHLTLHFLGDVGAGEERRLREALRRIDWQPMEIQLATTDVWRGGIAVLRAGPHDGLTDLHRATGEAVVAAGIAREPEFGFKPHVTLARNAKGVVPPKASTSLPLTWRVDAFELVWSVLPPEAKPARYEVVERFVARGEGVRPGGQLGEQLQLPE